MQDFKKLRVWQLAQSIVIEVVEALPPWKARRIPGLRSQAIRAAMSVAANLAEGCGRTNRVELFHFVEIAFASVNELEGYLIVAQDAKLLTVAQQGSLRAKIVLARRMLVAFMRTLQVRIVEDESSLRHQRALSERS